MVDISRPLMLQIRTPTLESDLKKLHRLLVSAGYQIVDEGKYVHTSDPTLSARVTLESVKDSEGNELSKIIELILSDADSHVNQTIYNALATVFPLDLKK
ncbi:MAG: hypothetical protein ACFFDW_03505 [Candidatus Thorarchaeota archaeon]